MTVLRAIARTVGAAATAGSIGSRTLLSLDTNPVPGDWGHITKVDPEYGKDLPLLYPLYLQHTSALEIGGSKDVTGDNTEQTLGLVAGRPSPAFQEPSGVRQVTDTTMEEATFLAIPEVLNGDAEALVGTLGAGIEYLREELGPELLDAKAPWLPAGVRARLSNFAASWMLARKGVFEAYVIMNPDSAAAREANVGQDDMLDPRTAKQRALAAETHHESEIIYLEYSGTFGGEEAEAILGAIDDGVSWSRIWYGGGLDNRENAEAVLEAGADAVVVGNIFHEIAAEEADLCVEARETLGVDATRREVEEWIDANVDVAETNATRYLSTNPAVPDPTGRARDYLALTVETYLAIERLLDRLAADPPATERAVRSAINDWHEFPAESELRAVLPDSDQELPRLLVAGLLADAFDVEADLPPVHHLSVDFEDY